MMMQDTSIYQHLEQSRGKTEPSGKALASLHQVYKRFDRVEALKGVSLELFAGELLALLGPNGSGKTTTLSLLLGLRKPDQGIARLFGLDPRLPQARKQVGATPQETAFPETLKVREIITLVQVHYPVPSPTKDLLEHFGLTGLENRQVGGLSGGQKRRLAVALAFAGNPRVVFLDEPTVGLDVEARRELWQEIAAYRQKGGTVLLTTHYLEEAEALASRVFILHKGQKVSEGSVEEIKAQVGLKRVRFAASSLPALPGVARVEQEQGAYSLYTADPEALVRYLVQQNVDIHGLEVASTTLEEAFLHLTGGEV
jgi:ABC-2 type transport system ATP-binding protein